MYIKLIDNHGLYKSGSRLDVINDLGEQLIKDGKAMRIITAKTVEHTEGMKPHIVKRSNKRKLK